MDWKQRTIVHKLDPAQFAVIMHTLTSLLSDSPEKIEALTAKLRASGIALKADIKANAL